MTAQQDELWQAIIHDHSGVRISPPELIRKAQAEYPMELGNLQEYHLRCRIKSPAILQCGRRKKMVMNAEQLVEWNGIQKNNIESSNPKFLDNLNRLTMLDDKHGLSGLSPVQLRRNMLETEASRALMARAGAQHHRLSVAEGESLHELFASHERKDHRESAVFYWSLIIPPDSPYNMEITFRTLQNRLKSYRRTPANYLISSRPEKTVESGPDKSTQQLFGSRSPSPMQTEPEGSLAAFLSLDPFDIPDAAPRKEQSPSLARLFSSRPVDEVVNDEPFEFLNLYSENNYAELQNAGPCLLDHFAVGPFI